jgi:hypothetical protein
MSMRNLLSVAALLVLAQTVACTATTPYGASSPSSGDARHNELSSRHTADRVR